VNERLRVLVWLSLLALGVLASCNLVREADAPTLAPVLNVRFESPANQTQVYEGQEIELLLVAEDASGPGVARVELRVDDRPHQEGAPEVSGAVPVFSVAMRWKATGQGLHSLTATAFREDGSASAPATILLQVVP
jgi:hypothetical protein